MVDAAILEPVERTGVALMLVGANHRFMALGYDPRDEFLYGLSRGLGIWPPVATLEAAAMSSLPRSHGPAPPEFRIIEAVDEVGFPDQEVQVEGPVVAGLEAAEAVQDEGLRRDPRP